ncbi:alpha/beta fold hydrolase [Texcoconibacillus texcoconensis]|uniref:Pimeloyl-ACP methyl ester carboxylesterase n=1 Tax=Texcoconibacillus texcoconensis TaxID=1095777 RepID=A0A840QS48_9BACI|nr:alpha/beta hydrolase [Texcoconibacillus texcoconensis]MBB5174121.1 pimeloyl-ACP methyl ester carboxylesterase [Texcoconibacillus texcoconensis]
MPYTPEHTGTRIYYETSGEGPPLVFVHPPSMGHVTFRHQVDALKKHFFVITLDLRGDGRSEAGEESLTMALLAEDVCRVLDACAVKSAYVFGYSNGGSIVQELAIHYPERVRGLILSGGFADVHTILLKNQFRIGILTAKLKATTFLSNVLSKAHEKEKKHRDELRAYIQRTEPERLAEMYQIGLEYKATERLSYIKCPVLLIYGAKDDYVHEYQEAFKKRVPAPVEVVYVSRAKHQVPTRFSRELNAIVLSFCRRVEVGELVH